MRIFLVRHGETVWNRARRLQGRADSPLTLRGMQLAVAYGRHLGRMLEDEPPDDIGFYVSPLGRTRQTASLIADCLGVADDVFAIDPLLAEHDVGELEGLAWPDIEARHGITREVWRRWDTRPPGGESRHEVAERAIRWLAEARRHRTAVLVTHGGLSRTFRAAYLKLGPGEREALDPHVHGRLFELAHGRCVEHVVEEKVKEAGDAPDAPLG